MGLLALSSEHILTLKIHNPTRLVCHTSPRIDPVLGQFPFCIVASTAMPTSIGGWVGLVASLRRSPRLLSSSILCPLSCPACNSARALSCNSFSLPPALLSQCLPETATPLQAPCPPLFTGGVRSSGAEVDVQVAAWPMFINECMLCRFAMCEAKRLKEPKYVGMR